VEALFRALAATKICDSNFELCRHCPRDKNIWICFDYIIFFLFLPFLPDELCEHLSADGRFLFTM